MLRVTKFFYLMSVFVVCFPIGDLVVIDIMPILLFQYTTNLQQQEQSTNSKMKNPPTIHSNPMKILHIIINVHPTRNLPATESGDSILFF